MSSWLQWISGQRDKARSSWHACVSLRYSVSRLKYTVAANLIGIDGSRLFFIKSCHRCPSEQFNRQCRHHLTSHSPRPHHLPAVSTSKASSHSQPLRGDAAHIVTWES